MNPLTIIAIGIITIIIGLYVGMLRIANAMATAITGMRVPAPPAKEPEADNVVSIRKENTATKQDGQ